MGSEAEDDQAVGLQWHGQASLRRMKDGRRKGVPVQGASVHAADKDQHRTPAFYLLSKHRFCGRIAFLAPPHLEALTA